MGLELIMRIVKYFWESRQRFEDEEVCDLCAFLMRQVAAVYKQKNRFTTETACELYPKIQQDDEKRERRRSCIWIFNNTHEQNMVFKPALLSFYSKSFWDIDPKKRDKYNLNCLDNLNTSWWAESEPKILSSR